MLGPLLQESSSAWDQAWLSLASSITCTGRRLRWWPRSRRLQNFRSATICVAFSLPQGAAASAMLPLKEWYSPLEAPLTSPYHKELQGVIERLVLKEHRLIWNSLARSWTDSERVVLEQVHTVPFVLTAPGQRGLGPVSVDSPLDAVELPLETVYERFQQTSHGFKDLLSHYLSGEKPKGFLETEEMLLVGSSLTGIGELALRPDGSLHLQPPSDGTAYFLRLGDWQTLLADLQSASNFWKWAALVCGLVSAAAVLHALGRAYQHRRLKREKEAQRREYEGLLGQGRPPLDLAEEPPENACVICLTNLRECVLLPCGHVCCCFRCFQALPNRTCPICRGAIERVVPLYQA
ncbi:hypothetical protein JRQ81_017722 [Phrynocephalus forsythii]|uniref:RING-type E3 ubiquitin transferase n=1 Tax=Phrynocephalus forsythii TaxID=171643 RepID=A0A9Q1B0L3_9SAUR|nr:hypothetical protein JRQ81_017722 [Phrynocephalus forsythii]